jgi:vacuolar-type H+-ATPase subunit H
MGKLILAGIFCVLGFFTVVAQNPQDIYKSAIDEYERGKYAEAINKAGQCITLLGRTNPKIESLLAYCYYEQKDWVNAKVAIVKYKAMVTSRPSSTADKSIFELEEKVDAQIADADTKVKEHTDIQRNNAANKIIKQQEEIATEKKNKIIAENKQIIETLLKNNASADLKSRLGQDAKEIEKLGIQFSDFKETQITFPDGIYTGELLDGKRQGRGTMNYNNGDVYTGSWSEDQRNGQGEMISFNQTNFVGEWSNDLFRKGKQTRPNGDTYSGIFNENGQLVQGEFIQSNGYYQKGTFDEYGVFQTGTIKIKLTDGTLYEGEYADQKYTGQAVMQYPEKGIVYTGQVLDGKKHGTGILKAYRYQISGNWANDEQDGTKKKYYADKIFSQAYGLHYIGVDYTGFPLNGEWKTHQTFLGYGFYSKHFFNLGFGLGTFTAKDYYTYYSVYDPYPAQPSHPVNNSVIDTKSFTGFNFEVNAGAHVELFDYLILKCNYSANVVALSKTIDYEVYRDYYNTDEYSFLLKESLWAHSLKPEIMLRLRKFTIGAFYSLTFMTDKNPNNAFQGNYGTVEMITFRNLSGKYHLFGARLGFLL